jgi:arsenate reductase (thioredoxin)
MSETKVKLQVLVFEGCPHAEPAIALARSVAERFGPGVSVERVEVDTDAKAASLGFLGSPSIKVNGEDVEGKSTTRGALCCRRYESGAGVPPEWMVEAAVLRASKPRGLLFLCVANSARSQMAEGIARSMAPAGVKTWSAGSKPTQVRSEAIAALAEIDIDLSAHRSKAVPELPEEEVDTVITLCGEEECPAFLGDAVRLHWGLPDPAALQGGDEARLDAFRETRDELRRRLSHVFGNQAPVR